MKHPIIQVPPMLRQEAVWNVHTKNRNLGLSYSCSLRNKTLYPQTVGAVLGLGGKATSDQGMGSPVSLIRATSQYSLCGTLQPKVGRAPKGHLEYFLAYMEIPTTPPIPKA